MNPETKAWTESTVFDTAKQLIEKRIEEKPAAEVWVTGSEIAHATGMDKETVNSALRELGEGRLHIRSASAGDDVEVLGVDHGRGADSLDEPVEG